MKLFRIFEGKKKRHQRKLLEDYNKGKVLQISDDNNGIKIDNIEYFKTLEDNEDESGQGIEGYHQDNLIN